ncbi:winged helix-turn-helix transcriptional regulator [Corynebacterium incognita]|uniref:Winged helix-turn-helix transcriptional regulator n=1 Tax=Corynebacterium incognita TaxID=2754725 RepID=A0A7G7CQN2_9CORY|nr:metalloregulator ArsR/SmtB family transcription factor [Corynebacterium incognita]QNE89898.1 winged helix-turn-helix transcriptional regulator [Corynebacterium incognita]
MVQSAIFHLPLSDLTPLEQAKLLAPTLAALSDEKRLGIVLTLAERPMTNREVHEVTGMSQALVSHHLAALRKSGVVESVPKGRATLNSICCEQLAEPVKWLAHIATLTPEGQKACCVETPASSNLGPHNVAMGSDDA